MTPHTHIYIYIIIKIIKIHFIIINFLILWLSFDFGLKSDEFLKETSGQL